MKIYILNFIQIVVCQIIIVGLTALKSVRLYFNEHASDHKCYPEKFDTMIDVSKEK